MQVLFATVFTFGASTQNVLDCRNTISMLAQLSWVFVKKHHHKTLNITSQNKMFFDGLHQIGIHQQNSLSNITFILKSYLKIKLKN